MSPEIVVVFEKLGPRESLLGGLEPEVDIGTLKSGLACAADASDGTSDAASTLTDVVFVKRPGFC